MKRESTRIAPIASGQNIEAKNYANKSDLARLFLVSRRTIDNWIRNGLPHLKISKRMVRFDVPEVQAWTKEKFGTQRIGN